MADDVIRRMQAQLLAFATDGVTRSEVPAGQLTILPEDERARILVEWNQTAVDYDTASCIDEVIAAQAARAPERDRGRVSGHVDHLRRSGRARRPHWRVICARSASGLA